MVEFFLKNVNEKPITEELREGAIKHINEALEAIKKVVANERTEEAKQQKEREKLSHLFLLYVKSRDSLLLDTLLGLVKERQLGGRRVYEDFFYALVLQKDDQPGVLQLLLNYGLDLNVTYPYYDKKSEEYPEQILFSKSCKQMLTLLIETNRLDKSRKYGSKRISLIHLAVLYNCPDVFKLLVSHDFSLDEVAVNGHTALHMAVGAANADMVKLVIEYGPGLLDRQNNRGMTALHLAAMMGLDFVFSKEKKKIPNPKYQNDKTNYLKYLKVIEVLTSAGADITILDRVKMTALNHYILHCEYVPARPEGLEDRQVERASTLLCGYRAEGEEYRRVDADKTAFVMKHLLKRYTIEMTPLDLVAFSKKKEPKTDDGLITLNDLLISRLVTLGGRLSLIPADWGVLNTQAVLGELAKNNPDMVCQKDRNGETLLTSLLDDAIKRRDDKEDVYFAFTQVRDILRDVNQQTKETLLSTASSAVLRMGDSLPLHLAVATDSKDIVACLLDHGADCAAMNKIKATSLGLAFLRVTSTRNYDVVDEIISRENARFIKGEWPVTKERILPMIVSSRDMKKYGSQFEKALEHHFLNHSEISSAMIRRFFKEINANDLQYKKTVKKIENLLSAIQQWQAGSKNKKLKQTLLSLLSGQKSVDKYLNALMNGKSADTIAAITKINGIVSKQFQDAITKQDQEKKSKQSASNKKKENEKVQRYHDIVSNAGVTGLSCDENDYKSYVISAERLSLAKSVDGAAIEVTRSAWDHFRGDKSQEVIDIGRIVETIAKACITPAIARSKPKSLLVEAKNESKKHEEKIQKELNKLADHKAKVSKGHKEFLRQMMVACQKETKALDALGESLKTLESQASYALKCDGDTIELWRFEEPFTSFLEKRVVLPIKRIVSARAQFCDNKERDIKTLAQGCKQKSQQQAHAKAISAKAASASSSAPSSPASVDDTHLRPQNLVNRGMPTPQEAKTPSPTEIDEKATLRAEPYTPEPGSPEPGPRPGIKTPSPQRPERPSIRFDISEEGGSMASSPSPNVTGELSVTSGSMFKPYSDQGQVLPAKGRNPEAPEWRPSFALPVQTRNSQENQAPIALEEPDWFSSLLDDGTEGVVATQTIDLGLGLGLGQ